jgi:hypothetical protein
MWVSSGMAVVVGDDVSSIVVLDLLSSGSMGRGRDHGGRASMHASIG